MKRFLLALVTIAFGIGLAKGQSPDMFNYQAVVRDDQGEVIANQNVGIKITILKGSTNGNVVYEEEHSLTTTGKGKIALMIGNGSALSGNISDINWGSDIYYLKVGLDETGGTSYTEMGTTQLVAVPYAQYADSSGSSFSGDYNDLSNTPDLGKFVDTAMTTVWDKDSTDDFSGNYGDLMNKPDLGKYVDTSMTAKWDKDSTDDFSGDYGDLNNKLWKSSNDTIYTNDAVGIGTDNLTGDLTVQGSQPNDVSIRGNLAFLELDGVSGNAGLTFSSGGTQEAFLFFDPSSDNMQISSPGNVSINSAYPQEQLDVDGAIKVRDTTVNPEPNTVYGNSLPIAYGSITTNGDLSDGAYGIKSVSRLSKGEYEITLRNEYQNRSAINITPFSNAGPIISTYIDGSDSNTIVVYLWDTSGSSVNNYFSITVFGQVNTSKNKKKTTDSEEGNQLPNQ